jgi:(2Fe-2S) ferredoxin
VAEAPPVRKLRAHVFVCQNERPAGHPRGCCKARGSEELLQALKAEVAKAGLSGEIRAQKSGCLDTCEYGASVVVYPEGVWYGPVSAEDAPEIVREHLVGGRPVERLRIPGK